MSQLGPMRIVIDTNVLVAGLRSRNGASFRLLPLMGDSRWNPCVSVPLFLEYEDVLKREFMSELIARADVDGFLDYVLSVAELVPIPYRIRPNLRDPGADRLLEVAAFGDAAIVTFNERDFEGAERHGVPILRPAEVCE